MAEIYPNSDRGLAEMTEATYWARLSRAARLSILRGIQEAAFRSGREAALTAAPVGEPARKDAHDKGKTSRGVSLPILREGKPGIEVEERQVPQVRGGIRPDAGAGDGRLDPVGEPAALPPAPETPDPSFVASCEGCHYPDTCSWFRRCTFRRRTDRKEPTS